MLLAVRLVNCHVSKTLPSCQFCWIQLPWCIAGIFRGKCLSYRQLTVSVIIEVKARINCANPRKPGVVYSSVLSWHAFFYRVAQLRLLSYNPYSSPRASSLFKVPVWGPYILGRVWRESRRPCENRGRPYAMPFKSVLSPHLSSQFWLQTEQWKRISLWGVAATLGYIMLGCPVVSW